MSKVGSTFYVGKGLKTILIHIPKETHAGLVKMAKQEDRSLQKTVRRILVEFVQNVGIRYRKDLKETTNQKTV